MSCSEIEILLDDYVDGELGSVGRRAVEEHVETCAGCRAALGELRRLAQVVETLPRGLAPERDLLPGIRAALGSRTGRPAKRSRWLPLAGLAAAAVLVVLAAWLGLGNGGPTAPSSPTSETLPASRLALSEFEAAELEYERAAARLLEVLEARRVGLSPETRRIVNENLQVIDLAIEKARAALEADPTDARNGHTLNALHRQKVELLWRLSRVS